MARLSYSKTSLSRQGAQLKRYKQFLPSLDLKRQQLTAERSKAQRQLQQTDKALQQMQQRVGHALPMLADTTIDLAGLVSVSRVDIGQENIVGVYLPVLINLQTRVTPYSFLSKPHWVDQLVDELLQAVQLRIRRQIEWQRLQILERAVKKITQRVNLFDKVLIPRTEENIRKIRIYLSDAEKAGVVNAKLTKRKRNRQNVR